MQCAHCATPVTDDARYCQSCGSQVSDAEGQARATAAMDGAAFSHLEDMLRADTEGEYVVERMLGRGGMAVVYLATEIHLSRKVALKVLPPELTFGHGVERFKREARTAAALDHPNIIPIYRVASGGTIFWYAMKYLDGRALDDILKERTQFDLEEALSVLNQVADALDYAHEHQVVHRDIKPANVMLDNRNRVVVTDFGIAKALTEGNLTASGSVIGTPYYMSPEQGMGKPVSGAADQYSVAVMAYRMLAGEVPFDGDSAIDILHKHCMVAPPPLQSLRTGLPRHVYAAVHRALSKDPERRFPSVGAFARALSDPAAAAADQDRMSASEMATMALSAQELSGVGLAKPAAAPAPAKPLAPAKPASSRRWIATAATVAVLAGGAGVAWKLTSPGADTPPTGVSQPADSPTQAAPAAAVPAPPTTGIVNIAGFPANATVTADGSPQSGASFALPIGGHELRIEAAGMQPFTTRVTLAGGDTVPVSYAGQPVQTVLRPPVTAAQRPTPRADPPRATNPPALASALVTLQIGRSPVDATVYVNGVELPSGRSVDFQVPPGTHLIRATHPTAGSKDTTITVEAGRTAPLRIILRLGQ